MSGHNGSTIVVAGATGRQGGAVARELLRAGYGVRALTRDPSARSARELSGLGAKLFKCDLGDTDTLKPAFEGAWGVFAVFQAYEQGARWEMEAGRRFTATARNSGIKHCVYSSAAAANRKTGIPYLESKSVIEAAVREARFESYVILRPAFLMENFSVPWMLPELEKGRLCLPLQPKARFQLVAAEDVGKFGRLAFRRADEFNTAEIDIAGDEKSAAEAADVISYASGRKVQFVQEESPGMMKYNPDMPEILEWLNRSVPRINVQEIPAKYGLRPLTMAQWANKVKWHAAAMQTV